jgi:hypothetical protein
MPTILLPTAPQLRDYTAKPAQLALDAEVEAFLVEGTSGFEFLRQLSVALRTGQTSLSYTGTQLYLTQLRTFLTDTSYGYGYTVTSPVSTQPQNPSWTTYIITVTWP